MERNACTDVRFLSRNKRIAFATHYQLRIYSYNTEELVELRTFDEIITSLCHIPSYGADDEELLAVGHGSFVSVVRAENLETISAQKQKGQVESLSLAKSGSNVVLVVRIEVQGDDRGFELLLQPLEGGDGVSLIKGRRNSGDNLLIVSAGEYIVHTENHGKSLRIFRLRGGTEASLATQMTLRGTNLKLVSHYEVIRFKVGVSSLALAAPQTANSSYELAVGFMGGSVELYSLEEKARFIYRSSWHSKQVLALDIGPSGLLSGGKEGVIVLTRMPDKTFYPRFLSHILSVASSGEGSSIAAYLLDGAVVVVDVATFSVKTFRRVQYVEKARFSRFISPDRLLVVPGSASRMHFFSLRIRGGEMAEKCIHSVNVTQHNLLNSSNPLGTSIVDFAISEDGVSMMTAEEDSDRKEIATLKFWQRDKLPGRYALVSIAESVHKAHIVSTRRIPGTERRFHSLSEDGIYCRWKIQGEKKANWRIELMHDFGEGASAAEYSTDGSALVVGLKSGVRVLEAGGLTTLHTLSFSGLWSRPTSLAVLSERWLVTHIANRRLVVRGLIPPEDEIVLKIDGEGVVFEPELGLICVYGGAYVTLLRISGDGKGEVPVRALKRVRMRENVVLCDFIRAKSYDKSGNACSLFLHTETGASYSVTLDESNDFSPTASSSGDSPFDSFKLGEEEEENVRDVEMSIPFDTPEDASVVAMGNSLEEGIHFVPKKIPPLPALPRNYSLEPSLMLEILSSPFLEWHSEEKTTEDTNEAAPAQEAGSADAILMDTTGDMMNSGAILSEMDTSILMESLEV